MPLINFAGIASGIDSTALIQAQSEATRQGRVKPNEDKVADLEETNKAFDEFKSKLSDLQSLARGFSSLSGGALSKLASSSKESVVSATAANGAINGSYDVTVNTLAKNHTFSFDDTFPSSSATVTPSINMGLPASPDRTISFAIGTGSNLETVNIVLTSTMTAAQFVDQFNLGANKAEAALVNVGTSSSPSFKIVITSSFEGTEKGSIATTVGAATLVDGFGTYSESAAANSSLTITGIGTITRPTNGIGDVIPGLTLNLNSVGTGTVKIADDAATSSSRMQEFVDLYNEIITFIDENNTIERQESGADVSNVFAPLANTSTDDSALTTIRTALSGTNFSGGSFIRILADLGFSTERDGTLKFDSDKFQTAIGQESTSVNALLLKLGDNLALTGGTIDVLIRFNGILDTTINSNKTLISSLNDRIAQAEAAITKTEEAMRARFARLESVMGQLQSQQSQLTSALGGLSK